MTQKSILESLPYLEGLHDQVLIVPVCVVFCFCFLKDVTLQFNSLLAAFAISNSNIRFIQHLCCKMKP